jgi:CheY-like chemotaxis protein
MIRRRAPATSYLAARGYDESGSHREDALLSRWPDAAVIVLDLGLPDIDGWEVALEGSRPTAIPIVALTGADLPHERVSAMRRLRPSSDKALCASRSRRCDRAVSEWHLMDEPGSG